jgi:FAD/FMN-containing dehydrogenase
MQGRLNRLAQLAVLPKARNEAEIALMRTLKAALDPDHMLNPERSSETLIPPRRKTLQHGA